MTNNLTKEALSLYDQIALSHWFEGPLGAYLLGCEKKQIAQLLARRKGFNLLHLGVHSPEFCEAGSIDNSFYLNAGIPGQQASAWARHEALPLAGETIDMAVLHHAMEYSPDPHQLLREVSRVLIAGGQVIVCGFNPISTWGVRRLFSMKSSAGPWKARMMTAHRMSDWLKLLGFNVSSVHYGAYSWPINSAGWVRYSSAFDSLAGRLNWPTGGYYVISARKLVAPLTPAAGKRKNGASVAVGIPVVENIRSAANTSASTMDHSIPAHSIARTLPVSGEKNN